MPQLWPESLTGFLPPSSTLPILLFPPPAVSPFRHALPVAKIPVQVFVSFVCMYSIHVYFILKCNIFFYLLPLYVTVASKLPVQTYLIYCTVLQFSFLIYFLPSVYPEPWFCPLLECEVFWQRFANWASLGLCPQQPHTGHAALPQAILFLLAPSRLHPSVLGCPCGSMTFHMLNILLPNKNSRGNKNSDNILYSIVLYWQWHIIVP